MIFNNRDLDKMVTAVEARAGEIFDEVVVALEETSVEADANMNRLILAATTRTGEARASGHGGSRGGLENLGIPGRVETGTMIDAVGAIVERSETSAVGSVGWVKGAKPYFLYQENGTGSLPAMHALLQTFISWRERFAARIQTIGR